MHWTAVDIYTCTCIITFFGISEVFTAKQPHILFIIADDLGYNDIGYHNSEIKTPVLDKLAHEGVKLENYYVQPLCSPTRSQLMTGRYQIRTGIQHSLFWPLQPNGLPLGDPTLADKLKEAGYSTHAVGKWHLGFYRDEFLPTRRGFDSFFGILNGKADHYQYNDTAMGLNGLDLRDGIQKVNYEYRGQYSTTLYARKAIEVVQKHQKDKPLFVYLSFQAVHSPLQVPDKFLKPYQKIADENRRLYSGMTTSMDEAIGDVVKAFKDKGIWDDTLLVFTTDNGGQVSQGGNNSPLRGWKGSLWEGGIKAVGFVNGYGVKQKQKVSKELIHVSDWFPTLVNLCGGTLDGTNALDGQDQWKTISRGAKSARKSILHNIDPLTPNVGKEKSNAKFDTRQRAALRHGDWKIITGDPGNGSWIHTPAKTANSILYQRPENKNIWLFNVKVDPSERHDMSAKHPEIVDRMLEMLAKYSSTSVPCYYPENDPMADPKYHDGYWGPWVKHSTNTEIDKHVDNSRPMTFGFLSIVFLILYCLYYRFMRHKRLCKQHPTKYKI